MEKTEIITKAFTWFEKEYHQTPAQCGYLSVNIFHQRRLFKKINQVIFAKDDESAQAYQRAQQVLESSYYYTMAVIFLIGAVVGIWFFLSIHKAVFLPHVYAFLVPFGLLMIGAIGYICKTTVRPLEKKYLNKVVVYTEVKR